jgi:hypothetical protein
MRSFSVIIEENVKIKSMPNGGNDIFIKLDSNNINETIENPNNKSDLLLETSQKKKKCCACMII